MCIVPLPHSKLHVPSGSFALIWSPEFFVMSSHHEASCYEVFATLLLLPDNRCKHRFMRTQAAVVLGVGSSLRLIWVELVRNLVAHGRGSEGETGEWSG